MLNHRLIPDTTIIETEELTYTARGTKNRYTYFDFVNLTLGQSSVGSRQEFPICDKIASFSSCLWAEKNYMPKLDLKPIYGSSPCAWALTTYHEHYHSTPFSNHKVSHKPQSWGFV